MDIETQQQATGGLDDEVEATMFTLYSSEQTEHSVPLEWCRNSKMIMSMVEESNNTELSVSNASSDIIELVVEYLEIHKGVEGEYPDKPLKSMDMQKICKNPLDFPFIDKISLSNVYNLAIAANWLGCSDLLELCCAKISIQTTV